MLRSEHWAARAPLGIPVPTMLFVALVISLFVPEVSPAQPQKTRTVNVVVELETPDVARDTVLLQLHTRKEAPTAARLRRSSRGHSWAWDCLPGDILSVDAPGHEPADIDDRACSKPVLTVTLLVAREVALRGDLQHASLEWRADAPGGSTLIATRQLDGAGPPTVRIARRARLLRILRPGFSPVSMAVDAGADAAEIRVPPTVAGGEFYGVLAESPVQPTELVLTGRMAGSSVVPLRSGRAQWAGLTPGPYSAVPRYRGGIEGGPLTLTIRDQQTTEAIPLSLRPVGGLILSADYGLVAERGCRLSVRRLEGNSRSMTYRNVFTTSVSVGMQPEWTIGGLSQGRYEALLEAMDSHQLVATQSFDVIVGAEVQVRLEAPNATVSGRVRFGKRPASGVIVSFNRGNQQWRARTDEEGMYVVALGAAASYTVQVMSKPYLASISRPAAVHEGPNVLDLDFGGASIRVKLVRSDGGPLDEGAQVHLRSPVSNQDGFVLPEDGAEFEFFGLLPGIYRVGANTPSGLVSEETVVTLAKEGAESEVVLSLDAIGGELELKTETGEYVPGATATASGLRLSEVGTGLFRLARVSPGSPVLVSAPGFVPACRLFRPTDLPTVTITLVRGTETGRIQLTPTFATPIGVVADLPGSDCDVPLAMFSVEVNHEGGSTFFRVSGLPEGLFRYRPTSASAFKPWQVPGPAVTFVAKGR